MKLNVKSILIVLVIFLLGTNIAIVISYQLHYSRDKVKTSSSIEFQNNQIGQIFNNKLNLDSKQQDMFREFRRKYNRSANQTISEMNSIRNNMASELNSIKPDRKKLDKLSDKLGDKHKDLKRLTFDYYFNLLSVLDKDQQKKMVGIFQTMLTDSGDAIRPRLGRGGMFKHRDQNLKVQSNGLDSIKIEDLDQ